MLRVLVALLGSSLLLLAPLRAAQDRADIPVTGEPVPALAPFDELMLAFLKEHEVPGAALAIAKDGELLYSRGFGYADPDAKEKTLPTALFRIASVSKPITALAILLLIERGKLRLDDKAFDLVPMTTTPGRNRDPRLKDITVRHLLQHTGGWDRAKSFDPMFRPIIIAKELDIVPPANPEHVIRYMLGQPLDFEPGSRYAYSNFGYCVAGRIIEKVSGQSYETFVRDEVLRPAGATRTKLGKTLQQAEGEVKYRDPKARKGPAVIGELGKFVPTPYGAWHLEAMDAHGGWISSADELAKLASALRTKPRPILAAKSWEALVARPEGKPGFDDDGKPRPVYYGLGWNVRPEKEGCYLWHMGALDGTATLLLRRPDGIAWAVLFNSRVNAKGDYLAKLIDPLLHEAAAKVGWK